MGNFGAERDGASGTVGQCISHREGPHEGGNRRELELRDQRGRGLGRSQSLGPFAAERPSD